MSRESAANQKKFDAVMPEGVSFGSRGFKREANTQSFMTNVDDVSRTPLLYTDPLWDSILLMFPEDNLKEVNKRLRHYYKYQPIFGNCVDIHSTFPMSDFECMVDDDSLKEYYTFLKDKYQLVKMGEWMLRDRILLGEALFVGNWDKYNYEWKEWVQYPPEYVDIRKVPGTNNRMIRLLPDPDLQKIANSNSEEDMVLAQIASQYNPKYFETASMNESYPVSEDRVIHFANQPAGYTLRGFSLGKRALKDLLYEDKLRMLQYTFVDRHMFPLKIFKLGSKEKGWIPGQSHFNNFKKLLIQAANDPDFSIIYHFGLEVEYVGTKDKIENLIPHFEHVQKRIMVGMFANDALISGESPGYSSQTVNLRMLMHRYMTTRQDLQDTYKYKMYLPIAKAQKFVRQTPADAKHTIKIYSKNFPLKKYYLPDFLWRKLNLLNSTTEQEFLLRLYEKGDLPFTVLSDVFGYDNKILEKYWKNERGTMADRNYRAIIEENIKENPKFAKGYLKGRDPRTLMEEMAKDVLEEKNEEKENKKPGAKKEKPEPVSTPRTVPLKEAPTAESEKVKKPIGGDEVPL